MNSDFGERQFEAAFNHEVISTLGPMLSPGIPVIPTTNQEAAGGWDALFKIDFGFWYFLQYKVVTAAFRRTGRNQKFWDFHRGNYLRFTLHQDSKGECRQHRLLSELRAERPGVYYCIPSFVQEEELWQRVASRTVFDGSRLIDLADVSLRDHSGRHQISYDETGRVRVWSESGEESVSDRSAAVLRSPANRQKTSRETVAELFVDATSIAGRSAREHRGPEAYRAWLGARVPQRAREPISELEGEPDRRTRARMIAEMIPAEELIPATSQVLRLDFGLTWIVEPAA